MKSARLIEIITLVCEGKTNQQIGTELHIGEKTVKNYLYTMFRQLHVPNRTAAAVAAIRTGLVPLEPMAQIAQGAPEMAEEHLAPNA